MASGKLREDLLYRLQVFPLQLPPLRERGAEDIELLADHFLDQLNQVEGTGKVLSLAALEVLKAYNWPGNVRELKNVIQRAFIMATDVIDTTHLPLDVGTEKQDTGPFFQVRVGSTVAELEKRLILATLKECNGTKEKPLKYWVSV